MQNPITSSIAEENISLTLDRYPPDRQIIYLDVARPKALIVIKKASQEAGNISSQVRSFITDNLRLKAEIPGLMLEDDGSLIGGQIEGKDVLLPQVHLAIEAPNLIVGPDDIPTLSFTSGSEGRPKGVQGRHFSLTYYFPWMAKTFNLSKNDKFTMLSGIGKSHLIRMGYDLTLNFQHMILYREICLLRYFLERNFLFLRARTYNMKYWRNGWNVKERL